MKRSGTFAGLVLFEPVVEEPGTRDATTQAYIFNFAMKRQYRWETREDAVETFTRSKGLSTWDRESLACWLEGAIVPEKDGSEAVVLACHPTIEAAAYCGERLWPSDEEMARVACPLSFHSSDDTWLFDFKYYASVEKRWPRVYKNHPPMTNTTHNLIMEKPMACAAAIHTDLKELACFTPSFARLVFEPRVSLFGIESTSFKMQLRFVLWAVLVVLARTIVAASPLSYIALYVDAACSSTPSKFTFTADPTCVSQATPTCSAVAGSSVYSAQACTTTSDYKDVVQAAFPSSLFLVVEKFSDAGECSVLNQVEAYIADGLCHVAEDGVSSFKASNLDDMGATLTTFNNVDCSGSSASQVEWNIAQLSATSCAENADQIAHMGGATSKWSIMTFFTDSECSKPVTIQVYRRFACEAEKNAASAECSYFDQGLYSAWRCAEDYVAFTASTFGSGVPFLVEEWYYDQVTCTELEHYMIYPADGSCVPLGGPNYVIELQAGGTVAFETFPSSGCSGSSETQTMDRVSLAAKTCPAESNIKFHVGGVTPQWKAIATYENADCSNIPVKLTFTSEFTCKPLTSESNDGCVATGEHASSQSDCTDDYSEFSQATFGENHPYVVVDKFIGEGDCSVLEIVTVYAADGLCHNNLDGLASFSVEVQKEFSATIATYDEPDCASSGEVLSVANTYLESHSCVEGEKKFYLGGLTSQWTAVMVYDSNDCTKAPLQITFTKEPIFAADAFDGSPYLVVETYEDDSDCSVLESIMVYLADEECHASIDATTGVIAKLDANGAATLALYDDVDCLDETPSTNTLSVSDQGVSSCSEGNLRLRFVKDTPEPTSETPSSTTESPTTGSTSTTPTPLPATKTPESSVPASTSKAPTPTPSSAGATKTPNPTAKTPQASTPSPTTNYPTTPATDAPASSTTTTASSAFVIEPMLIQVIAVSILIGFML